MERVASGAAKNLAGAVRQLDNERDEAKDGAALAANLSKPLDEAVTLHRAAPLEELERLRAEFLGMVSHDLRVPLTSIKGSAATVLGAPSSLDRAEIVQFFRIIDSQAVKGGEKIGIVGLGGVGLWLLDLMSKTD